MPLVIHGFDSCFLLRLERVMKKSMLILQLVYLVQGVKYIVNVFIISNDIAPVDVCKFLIKFTGRKVSMHLNSN